MSTRWSLPYCSHCLPCFDIPSYLFCSMPSALFNMLLSIKRKTAFIQEEIWTTRQKMRAITPCFEQLLRTSAISAMSPLLDESYSHVWRATLRCVLQRRSVKMESNSITTAQLPCSRRSNSSCKWNWILLQCFSRKASDEVSMSAAGPNVSIELVSIKKGCALLLPKQQAEDLLIYSHIQLWITLKQSPDLLKSNAFVFNW